jgi:CRP-like cAMP-binding protein
VTFPAPNEWLIQKLDRLSSLSDLDKEALAGLPYTMQRVGAGHHLVREGSTPTDCCLLVEGFACRYKLEAAGGRQIVSFHIRGDILDLQHLLLSTADHHVLTITEATIAWTPKSAIREVARECPTVAEALWKDTLIDASIFREWVLNVGRRDAKSRVAHMLCEFIVRGQAMGLDFADRFTLPMTQEQIADATGLTSVHVNRTLRMLREQGLIEYRGRQIKIADWASMQRVADFDPIYLHAAAA